MSRRNWAADRYRDAKRRQGVQFKHEAPSFMAPLLPGKPHRPPPKSKEELRADAARAFMEWRAKRAADERE